MMDKLFRVFYRAKIALDECCQALIGSSLKLPTLCISGVDHFQNVVVFAKVQADEEFDRLVDIASMLPSASITKLTAFYVCCIFFGVI